MRDPYLVAFLVLLVASLAWAVWSYLPGRRVAAGDRRPTRGEWVFVLGVVLLNATAGLAVLTGRFERWLVAWVMEAPSPPPPAARPMDP